VLFLKKFDKLFVGNLNFKKDFGYVPQYVLAMCKILQIEKADYFIINSGTSVKLKDIVEYVFYQLDIDTSLIIEDKKIIQTK
jgi:GDPmannose 4,6-dehydratase